MKLPGREQWIELRDRLLQALTEPAPENADATVAGVPVVVSAPPHGELEDWVEEETTAHARAAAALGALPVVDLVAVTTLQARLLRRIADLHGFEWDRELALEFVTQLGPGIAGGLVGHTVGRSAFKIIPLLGQTVGAMWGARSSTIATYAVGKSAHHFLASLSGGKRSIAADLRRVHAVAERAATARLKELMAPARR